MFSGSDTDDGQGSDTDDGQGMPSDSEDTLSPLVGARNDSGAHTRRAPPARQPEYEDVLRLQDIRVARAASSKPPLSDDTLSEDTLSLSVGGATMGGGASSKPDGARDSQSPRAKRSRSTIDGSTGSAALSLEERVRNLENAVVDLRAQQHGYGDEDSSTDEEFAYEETADLDNYTEVNSFVQIVPSAPTSASPETELERLGTESVSTEQEAVSPIWLRKYRYDGEIYYWIVLAGSTSPTRISLINDDARRAAWIFDEQFRHMSHRQRAHSKAVVVDASRKHRRAAAKLQLSVQWPAKRDAICKFQKGKCGYQAHSCSPNHVLDRIFDIDHFNEDPGDNSDSNLIACCQNCHRAKGVAFTKRQDYILRPMVCKAQLLRAEWNKAAAAGNRRGNLPDLWIENVDYTKYNYPDYVAYLPHWEQDSVQERIHQDAVTAQQLEIAAYDRSAAASGHSTLVVLDNDPHVDWHTIKGIQHTTPRYLLRRNWPFCTNWDGAENVWYSAEDDILPLLLDRKVFEAECVLQVGHRVLKRGKDRWSQSIQGVVTRVIESGERYLVAYEGQSAARSQIRAAEAQQQRLRWLFLVHMDHAGRTNWAYFQPKESPLDRQSQSESDQSQLLPSRLSSLKF